MIIFSLVTIFHFWLQFIVVFIMFHVLRKSEACLHQASQSLIEDAPDIPLTLQSQMLVYSFGGLFCSYVSIHTLFATLGDYDSFGDAVVAASLLSLFVFLLVGSMKHIAFCFHFFRGYDIENGAISLLTMMSIIMRFIFVTPIWVSFLGDAALTKFPEKLNTLCIIYIIAKVGCLWSLCVDFAKGCACFFKAVLLRAPVGSKCEVCKDDTAADFATQCGHNLCKKCIEKSRKVNAYCPICSAPIPRKWTMPFKYGTISTIVLACIF